MKILLVEDEPGVSSMLKKGLEEQQYSVTIAQEGNTGQNVAYANDFDLVILDVMLPDMNGFDVCRNIRAKKKDLPILILTALHTVTDKIKGLESGADDYISKPFHFDELLARIKALLRRHENDTAQQHVYVVDDLVLNSFKRTVTRNNKEVVLTTREYNLLELLMANKNKILSRNYITEKVWGKGRDGGTNLIDVYINFLRTKIDRDSEKKLIHTVIGIGYVIREDNQ